MAPEWTPEAIRALGPTTDIPTLASIFDCSPWKAYEMARKGEWEAMGVRVVRLGPKYRVIVLSILEVLHFPQAEPSTEGEVMSDGAGAAAFAALEAIESGSWDRYLLRLRAAIEQRRATEAYKEHIVAGTPGHGQ